MKFVTDEEEASIAFDLPKKVYSLEGLQLAAVVFDTKAEVDGEDTTGALSVTLTPKRKKYKSKEGLEKLAGEFLNELLNQEYRFIVSGHNKKISGLTLTQALFSARGGENPKMDVSGEKTEKFKAEVDALMKTAAKEIKETMPVKLPPQGTPIPPDQDRSVD